MPIATNLIKFYKCATWTKGDVHGGDISATEISKTNIDKNIFDDISNAERESGIVGTNGNAYRKIYFKNENIDQLNDVKCWINQLTLAENDEIAIAKEHTSDTTHADTVANIKPGGNHVLTFRQPTSKTDTYVLNLGTISAGAYVGIWIRRLVKGPQGDPQGTAGDGYTENSFQLSFENN